MSNLKGGSFQAFWKILNLFKLKKPTSKCSVKQVLSSPIRYNRGSEKCCSKMKNIRSEEKLEKEDAFYSC